MIEAIGGRGLARGARARRPPLRHPDRQRAPVGAPELHADRPQGARDRGDGRLGGRRAAHGDRVRLLGSRRARLPLRRRFPAGVGRRRRRDAVPRARARDRRAVLAGRRRSSSRGRRASTRCSRRTCSCCGSTPVPATRTPGRTRSTTAGCCCCARSTRSDRRTFRGAPTSRPRCRTPTCSPRSCSTAST